MFWDNFDRISRQAGTTPSGACISVGIGQNRPSNWKKNGTLPKQDELKLLADHLGCTVADFFDDDSGEQKKEALSLFYKQLADIDLEALERGKHALNLVIASQDVPKGVLRSDSTDSRLDEYERDFIRIYESLDPKTRLKLMSAVYEFDEEDGK